MKKKHFLSIFFFFLYNKEITKTKIGENYKMQNCPSNNILCCWGGGGNQNAKKKKCNKSVNVK